MGTLNTTWKHVRRSPYQAFAVIFIMAQTFFVVSFFAFVIFGTSKIISYFESAPQVTAFFKDNAKQNDIDNVKAQISSTGKAASIEFVSKQDALKIYREQNKDDPLLLELVTADVLPAALKISAVKIEDLPGISDALSQSSAVDKVVFEKDVVQSLTSWTSALRKIGIVITAILALDAVFIMVIITGIRISQKREEIEIVKLLGASNWYIRWPFMVEGISYGLVGAFVGWLVSSAAFLYAMPFLSSFLRGIPFLPNSPIFFLGLLGGEILLAVVLGIFSSFIAVLRYLK